MGHQGTARSANKIRALGEAAVGRRARGSGSQPPSGKDSEPSALRGPRQCAAPGAACRCQSTPHWAALDLAAGKGRDQPLYRRTCRCSPQRPQVALNRSKPPTPPAAPVATLACATEERSSRSVMHSSQSGVPSIRRTSASTRSAMIEPLVIGRL